MASNVSGGEKLMAALGAIADRAGAAYVRVGFLENAVYEGGDKSEAALPVAQVAFWNEFGHMVYSKEGDYYQLPRPFFRRMIAEITPQVSKKTESVLEWADMDTTKALTGLGEWLHDELVASIDKLVDPPLAPSTIAKKGSTKPLVDTNNMRRSVGFEVVEGSASENG